MSPPGITSALETSTDWSCPRGKSSLSINAVPRLRCPICSVLYIYQAKKAAPQVSEAPQVGCRKLGRSITPDHLGTE
jgi:hypothetical protein